MISDAETAYALALEFDLLETSEQRQRAGRQLESLVKEGGFHIRTGFVGTPLICDALCRSGHYGAAYRLLLQTECPSWLYPVTMGATTIWERWDSMLPDGSINTGEMTSFNHYALGAVADWMERTIAGLAPAEPGYRKLEFRPHPGGGLTYARASHLTPDGLVECGWKLIDGQMDLDVVVPPNSSAKVVLPWDTDNPIEIGSGAWRWSGSYTDPDFRSGFTLDDTVGDVMSDRAVRSAILKISEDVKGAGFLLSILQNEHALTLHQVLDMAGRPVGLEEAFIKALAKKE